MRKSNELLKDYHQTAFLQQLITVTQNLKFGPNMGLNVPTPLLNQTMLLSILSSFLYESPIHLFENLKTLGNNNIIFINFH